MEAKIWTGDVFPASPLAPEGMQTLTLDRTPTFDHYRLYVPYAVKDGMVLHLHIILPPDTGAESYPLAVYVQGSGWMKQQLAHKLHGLSEFAARGFVVAIVEYRPSTVAPFPAQIKDAKTAVRFLRAHAEEYKADVNRMFMWGDSSGGHTTVMTAMTMEQALNDETGELGLKAFVDFYGPTDIYTMNDVPSAGDHLSADSPEGWLIGHLPVKEHPELAAPVSPLGYISESREIRPLLIFHGDSDRIVPFCQSAALYEALKQAGKTVEFYKITGADHDEDVFMKPPVLDLVEAFVRRYL